MKENFISVLAVWFTLYFFASATVYQHIYNYIKFSTDMLTHDS